MKMKKIFTTILIILAVSCSSPEEMRFFMPTAAISVAETVDADSGLLPVTIILSRAAQIDTEVAISLAGDAVEGENFQLSSKSLIIHKGEDRVTFDVKILSDKIFSEELEFRVLLAAGKNYTMGNYKDGFRNVLVTKEIKVPFISIVSNLTCVNPYLSPEIHLEATASMPIREAMTIPLIDLDGFTGFESVDGGSCVMTFEAWAQSASIDIIINKIDKSGYDRTVRFALQRDASLFVPAEQGASADIRLYDPVIDFSNIWRTYAQNDGVGYQQRQSVMGTDGNWQGNKVIDMFTSSEGSNYLRPYKNMYKSAWNCLSNTTGGDVLMLSAFVPDLAYPAELTLADYGNNSMSKAFTSCDSLFRFVPDFEDTRKGAIYLDSPRTFTAFTALRDEWDGGTAPDKGWMVDCRATNGNILASVSPLIIDRIDVRLVRLEGTYDLTNIQNTFIFTAWFESESEFFMRNVDTTLYAVTKEDDGTWKVNYRIYPR